MKVAIVHYWLTGMRGGEKVVESLLELFPTADIYTHVFDPQSVSPQLRQRVAGTTFIQRLPRATNLYQSYLPLMPLALEQLDLRQYDLVISSESGPAKGALLGADALHVCYCHTPMRYIWDMYHEHLEIAGSIKALLMRPITHYLRLWDYASAARVDHFIANSHHVRRRINRAYRRTAEVIHPPVDTSRFWASAETDDYYLIVGQLVPYKRVDLAVDAFNKLGKRLLIVGIGSELGRLKRRAQKSIEFLGHVSDADLPRYYARCRALVFPGVEDFGIVPVEAMAAGRPVIAFRKGGACDTVIDGVTGRFFDHQTADDLASCVVAFEQSMQTFDAATIASHARTFDKAAFKQRFREAIARLSGSPQ